MSELFPTAVRYTGSSLTFNLAGIFGASLAPYAATWLARTYGLQYVGYYLVLAAALTLVGLVATRETKDDDLRVDGASCHPLLTQRPSGCRTNTSVAAPFCVDALPPDTRSIS